MHLRNVYALCVSMVTILHRLVTKEMLDVLLILGGVCIRLMPVPEGWVPLLGAQAWLGLRACVGRADWKHPADKGVRTPAADLLELVCGVGGVHGATAL